MISSENFCPFEAKSIEPLQFSTALVALLQAIAPYYITLFFVPAPELDPTQQALTMEEELPAQQEEEEESGFGNAGRIMQVESGEGRRPV